jgi:hypothetical protein
MKTFNQLIIFTTYIALVACEPNNSAASDKNVAPSTRLTVAETNSKTSSVDEQTTSTKTIQSNDTLTQLAKFISGSTASNESIFKTFTGNKAYYQHSNNIHKRWLKFDSTKMKPIQAFVFNEFKQQVSGKNIFYPFSGPDILYSSTFFPDAAQFTLIGLEPVGTLPILDDKDIEPDSLQNYFDKINSSLYAILNFSFFRTKSMKEDLRNEEVDGTIHLLLLFLSKTGHNIVSVKPFYIDSAGKQVYVKNTNILKQKKYKNPSVEIKAEKNSSLKTITYTSADLSNSGLSKNKGLVNYINTLGFETTYLKGASYLMHNTSFSNIRDAILNQTKSVVQDDSGIAIKYILQHHQKWTFLFYGKYTAPIQMFKNQYQADLDSLYKTTGSKPLGFGLGYNYRDKNSNFMIIKKQAS